MDFHTFNPKGTVVGNELNKRKLYDTEFEKTTRRIEEYLGIGTVPTQETDRTEVEELKRNLQSMQMKLAEQEKKQTQLIEAIREQKRRATAWLLASLTKMSGTSVIGGDQVSMSTNDVIRSAQSRAKTLQDSTCQMTEDEFHDFCIQAVKKKDLCKQQAVPGASTSVQNEYNEAVINVFALKYLHNCKQQALARGV